MLRSCVGVAILHAHVGRNSHYTDGASTRRNTAGSPRAVAGHCMDTALHGYTGTLHQAYIADSQLALFLAVVLLALARTVTFYHRLVFLTLFNTGFYS